jgi:hypothetical protein
MCWPIDFIQSLSEQPLLAIAFDVAAKTLRRAVVCSVPRRKLCAANEVAILNLRPVYELVTCDATTIAVVVSS